MAEATHTTKKIQVTTVVNEPCIVLTLSVEEAAALLTLGAKVGGDPKTTLRGYIDAITDAVGKAISGGDGGSFYFPNSPGMLFVDQRGLAFSEDSKMAYGFLSFLADIRKRLQAKIA